MRPVTPLGILPPASATNVPSGPPLKHVFECELSGLKQNAYSVPGVNPLLLVKSVTTVPTGPLVGLMLRTMDEPGESVDAGGL